MFRLIQLSLKCGSMGKVSFLALFREYIKYFREHPDYKKRLKPQTIRQIENKYRLVSDFLFFHDIVKVEAKNFDYELCIVFFDYLKANQYTHNYIVRTIGTCKTVLDFGANVGMIANNPAAHYKITKMPPPDPIYLTPDQITLIENYAPIWVEKQKARDMLVLQIHTGINYGDFAEIRRHHITQFKGVKYLIKPRHKNNNKQIVPLSPIAEAILERHNYQMKLLSNPKYNLMLKKIAEDLGIPEKLKCKDGRTIFFMNKINNEGYTLEATSKMGGHKTVKTTETYYAQVGINLIHNEFVKKNE